MGVRLSIGRPPDKPSRFGVASPNHPMNGRRVVTSAAFRQVASRPAERRLERLCACSARSRSVLAPSAPRNLNECNCPDKASPYKCDCTACFDVVIVTALWAANLTPGAYRIWSIRSQPLEAQNNSEWPYFRACSSALAARVRTPTYE